MCWKLGASTYVAQDARYIIFARLAMVHDPEKRAHRMRHPSSTVALCLSATSAFVQFLKLAWGWKARANDVAPSEPSSCCSMKCACIASITHCSCVRASHRKQQCSALKRILCFLTRPSNPHPRKLAPATTARAGPA